MSKLSKITLEEKYGLRYYSFLFNEICLVFILFKTHDLQLATGFVMVMTILAAYLPIKDTSNTNHPK